MVSIIPEVISIKQYVNLLENTSKSLILEKCPNCGKASLWLHGHYERKADRDNDSNKSLNPILIQRFFCHHCNHTCSVLPECIPPRRWYLWHIQQIAFLLYLSGQSLCAIAKKIPPSRHTVSRWMGCFLEKFLLHKDALTNHFPDLGRMSDFSHFWKNCLANFSLAKSMRICHVSGVCVP